MRRWPALLTLVVALLGAGACGDDDGPAPDGTDPGEAQRFPDVVAATATRADDGTLTFEVTVSSPYDTPQRHADAWRVVGPGGAVYGVRELLHDHAGEQPFTRSLSGVVVPEGVTTVVVEGRDLANGWGGATVEVAVPIPQ